MPGRGCERASAYRAAHATLSDAEAQQLDQLGTVSASTLSLVDALGLIRTEERTWPGKPVDRRVALHSEVAMRLITTLDDFIHTLRDTSISIELWNEQTEQKLIGEIRYGFPSPKLELSLDQDAARLPLWHVWEEWWNRRGSDLRDSDGFELLRAFTWINFLQERAFRAGDAPFRKRCPDALKAVMGDYKKKALKYELLVSSLLRWFLRLHPPTGAAEFALDAMETAFARVPDSEWGHLPKEHDYNDSEWRDHFSPFMAWAQTAAVCRSLPEWTPALAVRLYRLRRWCDEPFGPEGLEITGKSGGKKGGMIASMLLRMRGLKPDPEDTSAESRSLPRFRAPLDEVLAAHAAGGATDADVIDQLIGSHESAGRWGRITFSDLAHLTSRKGDDALGKKYSGVRPLVDRCRQRLLEVELTRGDTPTVGSHAALSLNSVCGVSHLVNILRALGKRNFIRGYVSDKDNKETVFSHLARCCFPAESDTLDNFKEAVTAAKISEQRLVELAVYAPHWARYVEYALGWAGITEGVWWIHAHTKGNDWTVEQEIRELWAADMNQHTSLTAQNLLEGAVDVAWFQRVSALLGEKRWAMLDDAAKYAATGTAHARARLFADAMLERVTKKELLIRVNDKRHQDSVRALGLLPLEKGKNRETDLLERYQVMQEFIRTSKQFGSQRQASEKRAAQIGQENLARTAGYADPIRLQWAMEARAVADLSDGPISITTDDVTVSLGIDPWGEIDFSIVKNGKPLATLPAALKKDKAIAALRARKTELKRQASRIRGALEQFMCSGERMVGAEVQDLMKHPLLAPMLSSLVLVGDEARGYPVEGGTALEDYTGKQIKLKNDATFRIAHPVDLLPAKEWSAWQRDCFLKERIQPFKQLFRELYTVTKTEQEERGGAQSRRYAGHQIQPRKAMALLGGRGWVHHPEEGVRKIYHDAGIMVSLEFDEGFFTPAEVEGLTLESVHFSSRSDGKAVKLTELSSRLFSETMRDLDLVVSVAHRGGIDPEASASTLEMRATLVRETCALLKIGNAEIKNNSVLIKGDLAEYTVHLGSGIVHKIPGEMLLIVAVHAQHRGRLFLPFADDDPRTAEIMSKVLLLARDKEIKDPSIIAQIRG